MFVGKVTVGFFVDKSVGIGGGKEIFWRQSVPMAYSVGTVHVLTDGISVRNQLLHYRGIVP